MALETITREEFDQRLDAANTQHTKELQQIEEKQENVEQLLSYYEHTLDDIERELKSSSKSLQYPSLLRKRLNELAEKTLSVAASV